MLTNFVLCSSAAGPQCLHQEEPEPHNLLSREGQPVQQALIQAQRCVTAATSTAAAAAAAATRSRQLAGWLGVNGSFRGSSSMAMVEKASWAAGDGRRRSGRSSISSSNSAFPGNILSSSKGQRVQYNWHNLCNTTRTTATSS